MSSKASQAVFRGIRAGDVAGVREAITVHPEVLNDIVLGGCTWLHFAATFDNVPMVKMLVEAGLGVNAPRNQGRDGPIFDAVAEGRLEVTRWLLDHGAEVNPGGTSRGRVLVAAINGGSIDILRLLLERGADPNLCYGSPPQNALSHALDWGRMDMAELLRSYGATEPAIANPLLPKDPQHDIIQHFERHLGPVSRRALVEIVRGDFPVSVHLVPAGTDRNFITLFTTGMSARAMAVPPGQEVFSYAELLIRLPADWPLAEADLANSNNYWPVQWLRQIARYPHENNTWLGGASAIIANGEPPQPFAPNTQLSSLLLLAEDSDFGKFHREDGVLVNCYSAYPLYREERALEQRRGILRLVELFQQNGISRVVDLHRPNVALLRNPAGELNQ